MRCLRRNQSDRKIKGHQRGSTRKTSFDPLLARTAVHKPYSGMNQHGDDGMHYHGFTHWHHTNISRVMHTWAK